MLENYFPTAEEEIRFKREMMLFIKENPDCFERSLEKGHITASVWLLSKDTSQALLMHHTKLGKWFQLGGHCDGNPGGYGGALSAVVRAVSVPFIGRPQHQILGILL